MIKSRLFPLVCFSVFILHGLVFGQDKTRFVTDVKPFPRQPIEVLSKSVGDKRLSSSGEVLAGPSWIKDFTLEIKNISKKNIVGANISFEIAATGNMKYPLIMPLFYNRQNNAAMKGKSVLRPGEVATISVMYYDNVVLALLSSGVKVDDVTNAKLSVRSIDFDDDTRWNVGFDNRRDPNDPERWIRSNSQVQSPL